MLRVDHSQDTSLSVCLFSWGFSFLLDVGVNSSHTTEHLLTNLISMGEIMQVIIRSFNHYLLIDLIKLKCVYKYLKIEKIYITGNVFL